MRRSPLPRRVRVQRLGVIGGAGLLVPLILLVLLAVPAPAAETLRVSLDYHVDSTLKGCPGTGEFRQSVVRQLGYDPFRDTASRRIVVRLHGAGPRIEGRMEWRDANDRWEGERRFAPQSGKCAALANAMVLATAIQIQLLSGAEEPSTTGAARVSPVPPPPPPPASPSPSAPPAAAPATVVAPDVPDVPDVVAHPEVDRSTPPPAKARPPRAPTAHTVTRVAEAPPRTGPSATFALGVGSFVGVGLAPAANAAGRLFALVQLSNLSLELGGEGTLPSTTRRVDGSGFSQQTFAATMAGCGHLRSWSGCLVGKLGQIRARGSGVDFPTVAAGVIAQAGFRLAATQNLGDRFFAVAHVGLLVTPGSWTVTVNGENAWTTPLVAGVAGLDVAMRFR